MNKLCNEWRTLNDKLSAAILYMTVRNSFGLPELSVRTSLTVNRVLY